MTDIKLQLQNAGFTLDQARQVIKDVGNIIAKKILVAFLDKLDPSEKVKIESMPQDQIVEYIRSQTKLPKLTKEEINNISDLTWDDYLNNLQLN